MRIASTLLAICIALNLNAQEDKIYSIVKDPARLLICEDQQLSFEQRKQCSDQRLLRYVTRNITYPEQAIKDSIEGSVVVRFVVKKNGYMGDAEVLRDIGGGCGNAALAVMDSIRADSVLWKPGFADSTFVDSYVTLPIRFKIPVFYDYDVVQGDTIYHTIDSTAYFDGGEFAWNVYVQNNLRYPRSGIDSCLLGDMDVQLLVDRHGKAELLEIVDINQLGFDFEFETISMFNRMEDIWVPAMRNGQKVKTTHGVRVVFQPPSGYCSAEITKFDQAVDHAKAGDQFYIEGKFPEALEAYKSASDLRPNNAEYIYKRGITYFEIEETEQGCADILAAKKVLITTPIDLLLPIFCKEKEE